MIEICLWQKRVKYVLSPVRLLVELECSSQNMRWSLVLFRWSSVLFPLATNDHWFSMPVGPLPLAAVGLADERPKQTFAGTLQLVVTHPTILYTVYVGLAGASLKTDTGFEPRAGSISLLRN